MDFQELVIDDQGYEVQADGTKKYRKATLGSIEEFRTETEAQVAADALRININRAKIPKAYSTAVHVQALPQEMDFAALEVIFDSQH